MLCALVNEKHGTWGHHFTLGLAVEGIHLELCTKGFEFSQTRHSKPNKSTSEEARPTSLQVKSLPIRKFQYWWHQHWENCFTQHMILVQQNNRTLSNQFRKP